MWEFSVQWLQLFCKPNPTRSIKLQLKNTQRTTVRGRLFWGQENQKQLCRRKDVCTGSQKKSEIRMKGSDKEVFLDRET